MTTNDRAREANALQLLDDTGFDVSLSDRGYLIVERAAHPKRLTYQAANLDVLELLAHVLTPREGEAAIGTE